MNPSSFPLVSIGMPVFNEARFLLQTLDSLIQQNYPNIELIISDNASTDETGIIGKEFASKFDWVHYHRLDKNLGPTPNFCHVLNKSNGKYFMWASGHDLWSNNFISTCVSEFEKRFNAAIIFGTSEWIDENGLPFNREYGWYDTRGMKKLERYFTILWGNMNPFLGMFRASWLKECPIVNTPGADLIILSRLSLKGDFIHAIETSWSRREFRHESSYLKKLERYKGSTHGFSLSFFARIFPLARLPIELLRGVIDSGLSFKEKLIILFLLIPTLPVRYISGRRK